MNTYFMKKDLRDRIKRQRAAISSDEKKRMSEEIVRRIISLEEYQKSGILLTYVSLSSEADTSVLIEEALKCGKRVAVPRCIEGKPHIEFYYINGRDDLIRGSFGLLEPSSKREHLCTSQNGFCVLPGLTFDRLGSRLGYGMGYYDRFLQKFEGVTAGLCFSNILAEKPLPTGRYDVPADIVVTDTEVIRING